MLQMDILVFCDTKSQEGMFFYSINLQVRSM
jgi:hypothetical protein